MMLLANLKITHLLYCVGVFFSVLYIYGGIDFALYSYERWGVPFIFDWREQLGYVYLLASPYVLAYHIQKGVKLSVVNVLNRSRISIVFGLIRLLYLITISLLPLIFTIVSLAFIFNDFNGAFSSIDLGLFIFLLLGFLSPLCSFYIIKFAFQYK
jgi:hypothetical protein